jgi:hypothetical protein
MGLIKGMGRTEITLYKGNKRDVFDFMRFGALGTDLTLGRASDDPARMKYNKYNKQLTSREIK